MEKHQKLAEFYSKLANRETTSTVYNPYKHEYAINNLKCYFQYFLENPFRFLLVGEAPGYDGCRWTGVPFTSGNVIRNSNHIIFNHNNSNFYLEKVVKEPTASIVWDYLDSKTELPLLWNSFPFHPHPENKTEKNRLPKKDEVKEGIVYLNMILEIFEPTVVCPLGRVAESTLRRNFPDVNIEYVRHPSRGGKYKFIEGMDKLFRQAI